MATTITITLSNDKARTWKYFLGRKYGKRKSLATLIRVAAVEIVHEVAKKETDEAYKKIVS